MVGIHFHILFFHSDRYRRERCFFLFCECKVTLFFSHQKKNTDFTCKPGAFFYVPLCFSYRSFARHIINLQTKE